MLQVTESISKEKKALSDCDRMLCASLDSKKVLPGPSSINTDVHMPGDMNARFGKNMQHHTEVVTHKKATNTSKTWLLTLLSTTAVWACLAEKLNNYNYNLIAVGTNFGLWLLLCAPDVGEL